MSAAKKKLTFDETEDQEGSSLSSTTPSSSRQGRKRSHAESEEKKDTLAVTSGKKKARRALLKKNVKKEPSNSNAVGKKRKCLPNDGQPKQLSTWEKINQLSRLEDFLPLISTEELELNKLYHVDGFRIANTVYGQSVMASLNDEFRIFLPKRIAQRFLKNKDELEEFQGLADDGILRLRYLGGQWNMCEFEIDIKSDEEKATSDTDNDDDDDESHNDNNTGESNGNEM